MKNWILISVRRRGAASDVDGLNRHSGLGRLKAILAGLVVALIVSVVLGVILLIGSVIALTIGILFVVAIGVAIVMAVLRKRSNYSKQLDGETSGQPARIVTSEEEYR